MRSWKIFLPLLASSLCFAAQPDRITGPISSAQVVALAKSLHPKAQPLYDQGPVDPSLKITYITMLMSPSAAQQQALDQLLKQQQDPNSANYHKWLTPQQFADRFGLSESDLNKINVWLESQGFKILNTGGGRNSIAFSGTAAQVESAFRTEIHNYKIDGQMHIANSTPLMIPAGLNGIVRSVMGVHSFGPHPANRPRGRATAHYPHPAYYDASFEANFLAPGDVATIYDINPLYSASTPIDGSGQKLAIIGQTDVYLADINDFRAGFNLNPITGCTTNANGVITTCPTPNYFQYVPVGSDPGTTYNCGDLGEADLDIEWSGAIARNAQIVFVNSPVVYDSNCNYVSGGGVNSALSTAINPPSGPPVAYVISLSYGICELEADNLETLLQQGNAEGVTIMNSSGDVGSATCDYSPPNSNVPYSAAVGGLAVSYPASSPEVTGVGGTEITLADDGPPPTNFWGSTNGTTGGSALTYIPEVPWNDDEELAQYCQANITNLFCSQGGSPKVTGWVALGASATAQQVQQDIWISAGGGGASNCFYVDSTSGVCLGAGAGPNGGGLAQPSYQQTLSVTGAPAGVRYVPDVSIMASPNFPGYIFCTPINAPSNTASTCADGIGNAVDTYQSLVGGTSASSPIFAGIVTLLNQYLGTSAGLGNINSKLYAIAGDPSYSAFHHVTSGDNNVYCEAGTPAGNPANVICPSSGVIGFSAANFDANTGYNLVAGLGSVDANELATDWADSLIATTTTISAPSNATGGLPVTLTANVTVSNSATATGNVNFYVSGTSSPLGTGTLAGGAATLTTSSLPFGSDMVTASYNGLYGPSSSSAAAISVTTPDFSMTLASPLSPASIPAGQSTTATLVITPVNGADTINFSPSSCSGLPTGASCSFSNAGLVSFGGTPATGTITLTITTTANMTVPSGVQTITITGTEGGTGGTTRTTTASFTITATNQSFTLAPTSGAATFSVNAGSAANISFTVTGAGSPAAFSPSALPITYTCAQSSLPSQSSCSWTPTGGSAVSVNTVTLMITTTGPTSQLRAPLGRNSRLFYALLLPGMFGIVFASAGGRKQALRGTRLLGLIVVLGASTLWLGSCGGSSNSSQNNSGTPAGSYSIVVNATTAGPNPLTATYTVKLTVTN